MLLCRLPKAGHAVRPHSGGAWLRCPHQLVGADVPSSYPLHDHVLGALPVHRRQCEPDGHAPRDDFKRRPVSPLFEVDVGRSIVFRIHNHFLTLNPVRADSTLQQMFGVLHTFPFVAFFPPTMLGIIKMAMWPHIPGHAFTARPFAFSFFVPGLPHVMIIE